MKKKHIFYVIYIVIIVALLTTSFSYHGKIKAESNASIPKEAKGKVIINLWLKSSNISPLRAYQVKKYNEENKDNIYVNLEQYSVDKDYNNLVMTTLASGEGPDIFEFGMFNLLKQKKIKNLDEAGIDYSNIDKGNIVYYEGKPLGVKTTENSVKFIWNKEIFKKAGLDPNVGPKTWDEVVAYGEKIKAVCPEVTPFRIPMTQYDDIRATVGEPSVSLGNIYTTFWDYKKGNYDFQNAKKILEYYNKMYKENLMDRNIETNSGNYLRYAFYKGQTAMMISTYEDRGYFTNDIPIGFEFGVSDLPKFNATDKEIHYFVGNPNFLVVKNDAEEKADPDLSKRLFENKAELAKERDEKEKEAKNKEEAIKKVYTYLLREDVNQEVMNSKRAYPVIIKNKIVPSGMYAEYAKNDSFQNEEYDPTFYLSRSTKIDVDTVTQAIKGTISMDKAIEILDQNYKNNYDFFRDREFFKFQYFIKK